MSSGVVVLAYSLTLCKVDEKVFISGQIGLIPSSLSLPSPPSLGYETALACQHVERICKSVSETTGGWEAHAQLIIYWHSNPDIAMRVRQALIDHVRLASIRHLSTCLCSS